MSQQNGLPTQVLVISGKKANRAYRQALQTPPSLRREEANLSQKSLNVPQGDPQRHDYEEAGQHAPVDQPGNDRRTHDSVFIRPGGSDGLDDNKPT